MARADLAAHIARVNALAAEIENHVPNSQLGVTDFRADLAGLLVVAIAASYEACVKETLVNYAAQRHALFAQYASNKYAKLSSKVSIGDLHNYAKTFDPNINLRFKEILTRKHEAINRKTGQDIKKSYEQLLSWRHDFAHAGKKNTTVEEAMTTHRLAQRVIYAFNESFDVPTPA